MKQGERPGTCRCTCRTDKVHPYKGWIGLTTVILSKGSVCLCAVCVYRPDSQETCLPTGGVLPGPQPSPGGKLAAIFEHPDITDGRHQRRRRDRATPWDRPQTLTLRM